MNKIIGEAEVHFEGRASRDQIMEAFFLYWKGVSHFMKDVRFPRIHLPKFGYLVPKISFVEDRIVSFNTNPKWGEEGPYLVEQTQKAVVRIRSEQKNRKRKCKTY